MDGVVVQVEGDAEVDRRLKAIAASPFIGKAELVADLLRDFTTIDPEYAAFVEVGLKDWQEGRPGRPFRGQGPHRPDPRPWVSSSGGQAPGSKTTNG